VSTEPNAEQIAGGARLLRAGRLVAFPTETVYGLGADASNPDALARLYTVKGRPLDHPVIVHLARAAQLAEFGRDVPDVAYELAQRLWPGPLTIIVRRNPDRVDGRATGGRDTVGIRVPNHPVALALLDAFDGGVAAPSANRFGRVSPTTAAHVTADLGDDVDLVLDGGPSTVGVESTIVDVTGDAPVILRVGSVTEATLANIVGTRLERRTAGEVAAPGTRTSHYAPAARVELLTSELVTERVTELSSKRVGVLAMHPPAGIADHAVMLDPPADVDEYARVLYARLRDADRLELDVVLVVPPPEDGVGAAVCDRLRRAAAG
jgi:L-threonylcarbamoyladenylate synthase